MKMNYSKVIAFMLPLSFFSWLFLDNWEFAWALRTFCGWWVGASFVYLWSYNDQKDLWTMARDDLMKLNDQLYDQFLDAYREIHNLPPREH